MSAITYVALREMEKTATLVARDDISVDAADDSINAPAGLLGFLADEWVQVSGFINDANNGWFQVGANSTAAKLLTLTGPINHVRLPGVSGNSVSTPDTAANSVTGDIEMIVRYSFDSMTPATPYRFYTKDSGGAGGRSWALQLLTSGTLNFYGSTDGTNLWAAGATSTVALSTVVAARVPVWIRFQRTAATGLSKFHTSFDYDPDTGTGTWTQLGADVNTTTGNIFDSPTALLIGSMFGGSFPTAGRAYYAELRNGISGLPGAIFNAMLGTRGSLTIVAETGETWTIAQSGTPPAQLQGNILVTEAAGEEVIIQGYKRGLNQAYSIEAGLSVADRSVKVVRNQKQALGGGSPETLLHRRDVFLDIRTTSLEEVVMPQWREFLASVEGGESFTFDRYGSLAVPVEPKTVELASDSYAEMREFMFRYRIAFRVRVLS
jgi:hypothetical protein